KNEEKKEREREGAVNGTQEDTAQVLDMAEAATSISVGLIDLIKLGALLSAVVLYASPLPEIREVATTGSLGDRSFLPYAAMWISAAAWVVYGFCTFDIFPTVITNAVGLVCSSYYCNVYIQHVSKSDHLRTTSRIFGTCVVTIGVFGIYCLTTGEEKASVIYRAGILASALNVAQYSSPLVELRMVVRRRSTESMSPALTAAGTLCSSLWTTYGFIQGDPFQYGPNGLGLVAALVQV
ncbi:unnamed protein product, partial [Phaeothamnion confervicola]